MTVITELDKTIKILEAQVPASPESPDNVRKAKSLERDLAKYFKNLEQAFPYAKIEKLYSKYVKE